MMYHEAKKDAYLFLLFDKTGEIEAKFHSSILADGMIDGDEVVADFSFIRKEGFHSKKEYEVLCSA